MSNRKDIIFYGHTNTTRIFRRRDQYFLPKGRVAPSQHRGNFPLCYRRIASADNTNATLPVNANDSPNGATLPQKCHRTLSGSHPLKGLNPIMGIIPLFINRLAKLIFKFLGKFAIWRQSPKVLIFACLIALTTSNITLNIAHAKQSTSQNLLLVTKEIIRNSATVGVEEAGTQLLGQTAWDYFQIAATPLFNELTQRFPDLSRKKGTEKAHTAAKQAVGALSDDAYLKELLVDGFLDLTGGQKEIHAEINNLEVQLHTIDSSLQQMEHLSQKKLNKVIVQLKKLRKSSKTTKNIDSTGELEAIFQESSDLIPEDVLQDKRRTVRLGHYITKVLEQGVASRGYRQVIGDVEYRIFVEASYKDSSGRHCRLISIYNAPHKDNFLNPISYCKDQYGRWMSQTRLTTDSVWPPVTADPAIPR